MGTIDGQDVFADVEEDGGRQRANSPDPGGRPRLNEENTGFEKPKAKGGKRKARQVTAPTLRVRAGTEVPVTGSAWRKLARKGANLVARCAPAGDSVAWPPGPCDSSAGDIPARAGGPCYFECPDVAWNEHAAEADGGVARVRRLADFARAAAVGRQSLAVRVGQPFGAVFPASAAQDAPSARWPHPRGGTDKISRPAQRAPPMRFTPPRAWPCRPPWPWRARASSPGRWS
jgi:hypothetical protein